MTQYNGKLASIGGAEWDSTSTRLPPRSSTTRLLERPRGNAAAASGAGSRPSSNSIRGGSVGTGLRGGGPGAASSGASSTGAEVRKSSPRERSLRDQTSPKEKRPQRQASPASSQVAFRDRSSPQLAPAKVGPRIEPLRTEGSPTPASSSTAGPSVPFSRTAAAANRKQMSNALKLSSTKESFLKRRQAALVSDHRQNHLTSKDGEDSPATLAVRLAQSEAARAAFKEALRHGKVRPRTLKLMFVGQGRAGKTSTLKALTGQGFDQNEVSTHGLHAAMPLVRTEGDAGSAGASAPASFDVRSTLVSGWQVVDQPEHEIHETELERSFAQYVAERLRTEGSGSAETSPTSRCVKRRDSELSLGGAGGGDADGNAAAEEDGMESRPLTPTQAKMPVDLIMRMMEDGTDGAEEQVMLKTWDFGGQREYYVMHHLFLTNRGIYLVITRLDAWLREGDLDGPPTDGEDEAFEPPLEALTFWLSSIHVHAPDAIIIIVGTHADKVASCREEVEARVEEEIVRLMERVPGVERQVVINSTAGLCFFPVDNSHASTDAGLHGLRRCIDQEATSALTPDGVFGQELPLPWVRLRDELEDCAEGTTGEDGVLPMTATFVLSLAKVLDMGREVGIHSEQELIACLRCLHNFGVVVFFDEDGLREHVVLNTQWLADAMAHVLNCPRVVQGGVAATRRLRERGELEDDLLRRHLWKAHKFKQHYDVLLRMLYRFDLLIPTDGSGGPQVHIVPCLLPSAPARVAEPDEGEVWDSLYFDFHGLLCRLLPTLFPKLVVASYRDAAIDVMTSLGVYRDSFRLLWMGRELSMDLLPRDRPQVVRLRAIGRHGQADGTPGGDGEERGLPLGVVRGLLKLVDTTLSVNSHLSFTAGILCEHCHAKGRSQSERHHVIDVNELLSERMAACRINARAVAVPDGCWAARWRAEALGLGTASCSSGAAAQGGFGLPRTGAPEVRSLADLDLSRSRRCSGTNASLITPSATSDFEDSMPSLPSTSRAPAAGQVSGPCAASASAGAASSGVEPICLLYSSPLWREGERGGGEVPPLDVQQEAALLTEAAGASAAMKVELATASKLARLLAAAPSGYRLILHLSLHCGDSGQMLLLEDDNGGAHAFSLEDLKGLLAATGGADRLGLVFLHACCSDLAGMLFVEAGAPHVICCRGAVFDATARCFTRAFYHAFCTGSKSVGQAFDIAKYEIQTVPQVGLRGEAEKYMLLPPGGSAHATMRFDLLAATLMASSCPSAFAVCSALLPRKVEDFCGRARDLWLLMQHLGSHQRRCVAVCGPEQVGKSALLAELARFAGAPGRRFEGRTVHLALSEEDLGGDCFEGSCTFSTESTTWAWPLIKFLRALSTAVIRVVAGCVVDCETTDMADDIFSPMTDARFLRTRIVQGLTKLEAGGVKVLLIIDGLDSLLEDPGTVEELRKVTTEILLRTERVVLVLGSREATFQALGAHKVVAFPLEPLRPTDCSRLFLWRVHRPLVVGDLSEAAGEEAGSLPLSVNAQNRGLVLSQLAQHPLLLQCGGLPGLLRKAADRVLPRGGSLWALHRGG